VPIILWSEFSVIGAANTVAPTPSGPEDLCTIMYTSGTTGEPKGVELTNRAVLATVAALLALIDHFHLAITFALMTLSTNPV
jgi:long-chain acyl-CoA synthetase